MKREGIQQLKTKELSELRHEVGEMKEKLSKLMFDLKSGKTANVKDIRSLKKDIAVHFTCINEMLRNPKKELKESVHETA